MNAAAGAASGALTDMGINDHFMRELAAINSWQFSSFRPDQKPLPG